MKLSFKVSLRIFMFSMVLVNVGDPFSSLRAGESGCTLLGFQPLHNFSREKYRAGQLKIEEIDNLKPNADSNLSKKAHTKEHDILLFHLILSAEELERASKSRVEDFLTTYFVLAFYDRRTSSLISHFKTHNLLSMMVVERNGVRLFCGIFISQNVPGVILFGEEDGKIIKLDSFEWEEALEDNPINVRLENNEIFFDGLNVLKFDITEDTEKYLAKMGLRIGFQEGR